MSTDQFGYGGIPQINLGIVAYLGAVLMIIAFMILYVGTRYCHHIFMCHKYHVKHTLKQCNLKPFGK